jgi:hypothetical protein
MGACTRQILHPFKTCDSLSACKMLYASVSVGSLARMAQVEHASVTAHSLPIPDELLVFFVLLVVLFEVDALLCVDESAHQLEVFFGQVFYFERFLQALILLVALRRARVLDMLWG